MLLLPYASELDIVDAECRSILTPTRIREIVSLVPDEWLTDESTNETPAEKREVYAKFLDTRIALSQIFVNQAKHAREALI